MRLSKISIDGIMVEFIRHGRGKPLLLLHGLFSDAGLYKGLIRLLGERYEVFAINIPSEPFGTGRLPRFSAYADILSAFAEKMGIIQPSIFAHSGSCLIAAEYAAKYRTKEIILADPAGLKYFKSYTDFWFRLIFLKTLSKIPENYPLSVHVLKVQLDKLREGLSNRSFMRMLSTKWKSDILHILKKARCRIKIIWAVDDELFDIGHAAEFRAALPSATITEVMGGHDWPYYRPQEIRKLLDE